MSRSVSNSAKKQETKPRKARLSKQMMVDTMMTAKKAPSPKIALRSSPKMSSERESRRKHTSYMLNVKQSLRPTTG